MFSVAPLPANEAERLERLRELFVLDSEAEPAFDRIARLASEVCGAPIALLSLIDSERQWFKANVGLKGVSETPRDVAFCAHAIHSDALFEVPDATRDDRFAGNPLVAGTPDIRFYAGAPLVLPEGERIGTLCVIDRQPRTLDTHQVKTLKAIAGIATETLLMRRDLIKRTLSARTHYEEAISDSERFVRQITDSLPVRIAYVGKDRRYRFVNRAHCVRFGRERDDILGRTRSELTAGALDETMEPLLTAALAGAAQSVEFEESINGSIRMIESHLYPDISEAGDVRGAFSTGIDITDRSAAEQHAQRQSATLKSVTESIPAIVAVVGADGTYRFANAAFERWCGVHRDDIIGRSMVEVLGREESERSSPWVQRALAGESVSFEHDYGEHKALRNLGFGFIPLWLDSGAVDGFVVVAQDVSLQRREERRLHQLAQRDTLTELCNRAGFEGYLEDHIKAGTGAGLALLYIDLDHFKAVNDTHGHPVGDLVLTQFAQRLLQIVRPTDCVARLGGDEFAVVLSGVRDVADARRVAEKITARARDPIDAGPLSLTIGASVGIAYDASLGTGWHDLMERADAMLYKAKQAGRGGHSGELAMPA